MPPFSVAFGNPGLFSRGVSPVLNSSDCEVYLAVQVLPWVQLRLRRRYPAMPNKGRSKPNTWALGPPRGGGGGLVVAPGDGLMPKVVQALFQHLAGSKQPQHRQQPRKQQLRGETASEEWGCKQCGFGTNRAKRKMCYKCGATKPGAPPVAQPASPSKQQIVAQPMAAKVLTQASAAGNVSEGGNASQVTGGQRRSSLSMRPLHRKLPAFAN